MKRLAIFTPLPPAATGIADYGALLLRELDRRASGWEIEAYSPQAGASIPLPVPVRAPESFAGSDALPMYHVGNSPHHDFLYPFLLETPGVTVLHDLVLHHARLRSFIESEPVAAYRADLANADKRARAMVELDAYRAEVREAYPERGFEVAEIAIRTGGGRFLYDYPLYEDLVRRSRLTLVHGTPARDEVLARCPGSDVRRVRMGVELPEPVSRERARERLGLGIAAGTLLASFGLVTPEKRIVVALRALARLRARGIEARYVLVGGTVPHFDARHEAEALGLSDSVELVGRVSDEEFSLYAFAADVCLNLRYPSAGETSATLLRLLACGRAVVVTDQLHVADFPEDVVARTSLDGDEDGLYCDLVDLLRDEPRIRALEKSARDFAASEHSPARMAEDYVSALEAL